MRADVADCTDTLEKAFSFYEHLDIVRQAVLADMVYQLGFEGFCGFRKMIKALSEKNYDRAADEMEDSLWYRQSGRRSRINTKQMRTGVWEEI